MNPRVPRILHVLSQRPGRTGSGVTLDAIVRVAAARGWEQAAVVGVPAEEERPQFGGLAPERIFPLVFERGTLTFPLPGMSDVMPYRSSVFSRMSPADLEVYREAWRGHLRRAIAAFAPDLIHSHHVWILSSLVKDIAPDLPVVTHCHATGLRQMQLCPHLAGAVTAGCARNEHFVVLHAGHREDLCRVLDLPGDRVTVIGAGYREDVFSTLGRTPAHPPRIAYAGKYADAKGLPWLLDAMERLGAERPGVTLHVAGSGASEQADALATRMDQMGSLVVRHGMLSPAALAELLRTTSVFVLPSFYEGLPLVLIEALACGNRLVATSLPGVVQQLAPAIGDALTLVPLPRLTVDVPAREDLTAFVADLTAALRAALDGPAPTGVAARVRSFTWTGVFGRLEPIWKDLLTGG